MKTLITLIIASVFLLSCKPAHDKTEILYMPGEKEIKYFEHSIDNIMKTLGIAELSYAVVNDKGIICSSGLVHPESSEGAG